MEMVVASQHCPIPGVCDAPAPLSMVSEWMPNGNVRQYVQDYPQVDRLQLVCLPAPPRYPVFILTLRQLLDICHGLQFLHSYDVIHGDLKGVCVLIVSPVDTTCSCLQYPLFCRTTF